MLVEEEALRLLRRQTIARFLREKRMAASLTQWQVAERLGYTSAQFISNVERGLGLPPMTSMPPLVDLFGIQPSELIDALFSYQAQVLELEKAAFAALLDGRVTLPKPLPRDKPR